MSFETYFDVQKGAMLSALSCLQIIKNVGFDYCWIIRVERCTKPTWLH